MLTDAQLKEIEEVDIIQKRLDAGRCPKCDTKLTEPTRCVSCNLQLPDQLAPKKSLSFP